MLVYRSDVFRNWPGTVNPITLRETEGRKGTEVQFSKCTTQSKTKLTRSVKMMQGSETCQNKENVINIFTY
jgi:hypothetical protein